jgi:hypothetical protein
VLMRFFLERDRSSWRHAEKCRDQPHGAGRHRCCGMPAARARRPTGKRRALIYGGTYRGGVVAGVLLIFLHAPIRYNRASVQPIAATAADDPSTASLFRPLHSTTPRLARPKAP